jgi:hypothetical protein
VWLLPAWSDGKVVNPEDVTAQMQSGIAFGLTAALKFGRAIKLMLRGAMDLLYNHFSPLMPGPTQRGMPASRVVGNFYAVTPKT